MASTSRDIFNGPVKLINYSTHEINMATADTSFFNGNIEVNSTNIGGILFGNLGGVSVLASGKTITVGSVGFTQDFLTLQKFIQLGSTSQALTLTSTAAVNFISATFDGGLSVTAPGFLVKSCVFNGTTSLTKNGTANQHSDGGNTFNGVTTIANSGTAGRIRMATNNPDTYNGNVSFESTGQDVQIAYSGNNYFAGNITINSVKVVFNTSTGRVTFSGSASQSLNGSYNYAFKKLTLNKSSNNVTANTTLSVDDSLIFASGNLITTSSNLLTMKAGSKALGASNVSFVSGPVKKIGNTSFAFPVGKSNEYRSIEIDAPTVSTEAFTAEYYNTAQNISSTMESTIDFFSPCNHWSLVRNTGSSNINITLYYDSTSCGILDSADLRMTGWNGTTWKDYGSIIAGNRYVGKIKNYAAISSYSYFSLAYRTTATPFVSLGPDTTATSSFTLTNVSAYGNYKWIPSAGLSCSNCLNPVVDLQFSKKYYLYASDYKGRSSVDSIIIFMTIDPLPYSMFPPAVDWKESDWSHENPYPGGGPQTQEESGDEWWYGHSNSLDDNNNIDGYITAGYSSYINSGYDEDSFGVCTNWELDPFEIECAAFETVPSSSTATDGRKRGQLLTSLAFTHKDEHYYEWHKNYAVGNLYMAKPTDNNESFISVGFTSSTIVPFASSTTPIIYNPGQSGSNAGLCTISSSVTSFKGHAYVVKVNKDDGAVEWQYIYGTETLSAISGLSSDYTSTIFNFIEIPGSGYRMVGSATSSNSILNPANPTVINNYIWILDIDLSGNYINDYLIPIISSDFTSTASDIFRFQETGNWYNIISGRYAQWENLPGLPYATISQKAFVLRIPENFGTLDFDNELEWFNSDAYDNNSFVTHDNSTNYYVKEGKDEFGNPIILLPVIYGCGQGCLYASTNIGEGKVYKVGLDGTNLGEVSIGEVKAFDLKIDVAPTPDFGFAVLSTKKGLNNSRIWNTQPCSEQFPLGYFNTDAFVAKYTPIDVDPEWYIQWDIDDEQPVYYPGDYKKQECMYTITQAHDGGFVVAGNSSGNFDDYYLCKLQNDCITRTASFASILDDLDREFEIGNGTTPTLVTWNSSQTVLGSVVIKNNAELVIDGSSTLIEIADSRRVATTDGKNIISNIIVQPGGKLTIDESTLDVISSNSGGSCDDGMWDGIQVLGQPTLAQNVTNQGYVEISNDSKIKNARIAICASEAEFDDEFQYLTSNNLNGAGIVHATNGATFENNRVGIWIGPFKRTYSINRIISCDFVSNSILRDPFYKFDEENQEVLASFIKLYGSPTFNVSANTFTSLNSVEENIRGNGIECQNCGVNISFGNTFTDLNYGIRSIHRSIGSTNRIVVHDNNFDNVYFSIYDLGSSFARIEENIIDVPGQNPSLAIPYGIWMNFSRLYAVNKNSFTGIGDPGEFNYGLIATNSNNSSSEIFDNDFDGTHFGTQTERLNNNLRIRCNDYQNHAHSIVINPNSPMGSLADQGTDCPGNGGITAGNNFLDACFDPLKKNHIYSTIEFNYYANGTPSSTYPDKDCSSDILSDLSNGEIVYCGSGSPDLLACAEDEPGGNNRTIWLDTLSRQRYPISKDKIWNSFLSLLIQEDTLYQDSTIVTYLDSISDLDKDWYKITWYIDHLDTIMVDSLMSAITLTNSEDSTKFDYFQLLRSKMDNTGCSLLLNSEDYEMITSWLTIENDITKNQYAWLENSMTEITSFAPELIVESRFSENSESKVNNDGGKLKIVPNPNNGNFSLYLSKNLINSIKIEIADVLGKIVFSQYLNSNFSEISVSNISPGIYFLNEYTDNEVNSIKFIIIEN
jgi:hypothetical protein